MTEYPGELESHQPVKLISPADYSPVLDARELSHVLRSRIKLLIGATTLGFAAALVYLLVAVAQYTAVVRLAIDTRGQKVLDVASVIPPLSSEVEPIEGQAEILRSRRIVEQTVRKIGFGNVKAGGEIDEVDFHRLMNSVKVTRQGLSNVIDVSVTWPDREEAARFANGLAETFLADQVATKEAATKQVAEWLEQRKAALGQAIAAAEKRAAETGSLLLSEGNSGKTLEQEISVDRELYASVLKRMKEIQMQIGMQVADAQIIARATPPVYPSSPVLSLTLIFGALGGFLIGLIWAIALRPASRILSRYRGNEP
jgi:uncharacterized protein involved in exopolysaccharide biosynthesis